MAVGEGDGLSEAENDCRDAVADAVPLNDEESLLVSDAVRLADGVTENEVVPEGDDECVISVALPDDVLLDEAVPELEGV